MTTSVKEKTRCFWCGTDPLYVEYHDEEWGVPVFDDQKMFEMLILEGFQAGLSWLTVLRKREHFRKAFKGFDAHKIARFTDKDVERLMQDAGIIRNRLKIQGTIINAKLYLKMQEQDESFANYLWSFVGHKTYRDPKGMTPKRVRATSPESDALSKDLKKRGFKFVGSTIVYAHMQATGMVNDHLNGCWKCP